MHLSKQVLSTTKNKLVLVIPIRTLSKTFKYPLGYLEYVFYW